MRRSSRTYYFPGGMLDEIEREAARLGRSTSSLLIEAWRLARMKISSFSSDIDDSEDIDGAGRLGSDSE